MNAVESPARNTCKRVLIVVGLAVLVIVAALGRRFAIDQPVVYADPVEHFKYGSTGGERNMGFPYWVFKAMPEVCGDMLPGKGYASLGFLQEEGHDLPVGMSMRHQLGIDRVFLNCAVCHTSTVRTAPAAEPFLVAGMPANRLNLMGFEKFMEDCARSANFSSDRLIPAAEQLGAHFDLLDRYVVYPLAIYIMRERVLDLLYRMRFIHQQPDWGPGRVDTFNSAKAIFNFPFERMPREELLGASDFPAIWHQAGKRGMQLHWDGNNDKVEERNLSAAFGTGATPPIVDHAAMSRIEAWSAQAAPPAFGRYFPVDARLAARGREVYRHYCAYCHGQSGTDFSGAQVGKVTPIGLIATDPYRLWSYTRELAENQGSLYAGYPQYRFQHFRKTFGYANAPLDGIWLRAPYLHNGSVPSLWDLLQPAGKRPKDFYRGNDLYDPRRLGFVSYLAQEGERRYFRYDTAVPGNGNKGHEGRAYGTLLPDADKWALIEYLKTF